MNGYFSQIIIKGMAKNGISIKASLWFPTFKAKDIIKTIDMAFRKLPRKNVFGINNKIPTVIVKALKTGVNDSLIPNSFIIFNDSGFFL